MEVPLSVAVAVLLVFQADTILTPGAKVVEGFQNIMPPYEGQLTEAELNALIAFIRSLQ